MTEKLKLFVCIREALTYLNGTIMIVCAHNRDEARKIYEEKTDGFTPSIVQKYEIKPGVIYFDLR